MLTAASIMTRKVLTVSSSATVAEAAKMMWQKDMRALIVERCHHQDAYGIITESDIIYKVIACGKDPSKMRVSEVMTKPCISINPDLAIEYVAQLLANNHLLRAPVIQGELLGIISLSDIISKSKFVELPEEILQKQKLEDAINKAREVCGEISPDAQECNTAWNIVDELQSDIAHQEVSKIEKTVFDEYCEEFQEAMKNPRFYDNWCSG
jgi:CBS domain-containing protein